MVLKQQITIIETKNRTWGFFGTTIQNYGIAETQMSAVFGLVGYYIVKEFKISSERVRCFLDSPGGRHFSDELSFHGATKGISAKKLVAIAKKVIKRIPWLKNSAVTQELF